MADNLYLLDIPLVLSRGQTKITDTTGATPIMIFDSVSSIQLPTFLHLYFQNHDRPTTHDSSCEVVQHC